MERCRQLCSLYEKKRRTLCQMAYLRLYVLGRGYDYKIDKGQPMTKYFEPRWTKYKYCK